MNVPQLRFDGFSEDWKLGKLGDMCIFSQGIQVPLENQQVTPYKDSVPFVRIVDVTTINQDVRYVNKPADHFLVNSDDVFMVRYGAAAVGFVGRGFQGALANNLFKITLKDNTLTKSYLYYYLSMNRMNKYIVSLASLSTMPALSFGIMRTIEVRYPKSLIEQEKIASLFVLLNRKLEKQQGKIEKLELFKKGMMQKIFSQELRFKEEDGREFGEWELRSLEELGRFFKGSGLSKSHLTTEGRPCILYGELYTKYNSAIIKVYSYCDPEEKVFLGEVSDVLIPSSGETAWDIACASALNVSGVAIGGDLNIFRPNQQVDGNFISYQINSIKKYELSKLAQGASVVHLYSASLKKLQMLVPLYEEQKKISSYFLNLESKIEKEKEKLMVLEEQKKGFMQVMFI